MTIIENRLKPPTVVRGDCSTCNSTIEADFAELKAPQIMRTKTIGKVWVSDSKCPVCKSTGMFGIYWQPAN